MVIIGKTGLWRVRSSVFCVSGNLKKRTFQSKHRSFITQSMTLLRICDFIQHVFMKIWKRTVLLVYKFKYIHYKENLLLAKLLNKFQKLAIQSSHPSISRVLVLFSPQCWLVPFDIVKDPFSYCILGWCFLIFISSNVYIWTWGWVGNLTCKRCF